MCGIAGILRIIRPGSAEMPPVGPLRSASGEWVWHGAAIDPRDVPRAAGGSAAWLIDDSWLDALDEQIAWRGPDGAGRFRDRVVKRDGTIVEVAIVHRRLSIIDIEGGAQPMVVHGCPGCERGARSEGPSPKSAGRKGMGTNAASSGRHDGDGRPAHRLLAVGFNGCIYNHDELRSYLQTRGHSFGSVRSDTEVLPHLLGQEWEMFLDEDHERARMRQMPVGMYALCIWDRDEASLVTSRDAFGEKPLYFWRDEPNGTVIFASTAGAVDAARRLVAPGPELGHRPAASASNAEGDAQRQVRMDRERDEVIAGVAEYIHLGFNARRLPLPGVEVERDSTDWSDLLALRRSTPRDNAAGCAGGVLVLALMVLLICALIAAGRFVLSIIPASILALAMLKYAVGSVTVATLRDRPSSAHTALRKQTVEQALHDSVIARLDADVPLGCFLSGGIDSSLIASFAREALGPALETYSMRMPDPAYDESHHAEEVARVLGSRHTTFDCDPDSAAEDLVHLIRLYGLPFGDSSILPTYWLCRGTSEHVKVALSGDGGDEYFFGYQRHLARRYLRFWPRWLVRVMPTSKLDLRDPTSLDSKKYRLIRAARHGGYADIVAVFPTADLAELVGWRRARGARPPMRDQSPHEFDRFVYLEGDLLRKTDLASMAVGLEVRCPFLDPGVVAAAGALSPSHHTAGGVTKAVLRDLARQRGLPETIVTRKKQGFAIPISDWFRTDFGGLRRLMLDHLSVERPFGHLHDLMEFNTGYIRRIIDEHWAAGGLPPMHTTRDVRPRDHGQRLFTLLTLAIWARQR